MSKHMNVLIVEDSEDDALLVIRELEDAGYQISYERVETPDDMRKAISSREWDIVISDYMMPSFNAFDALAIKQDINEDLPFIVISGTVGEEVAVEVMKAGAQDYLLKDNLTRLGTAVEREIKDAGVRKDKKEVEKALEKAGEEWQRTFDSISDMVFVQDKDFTITKANAAMLRAFKLNREDVIGKKCYEIMHKRGRPWPNCPFEKTRKDKEAHTEEVEDPELYAPFLMTTSPIFDDEGEFQGSVHVAKDISEFKNLTEAQEKHLEELEVFYKASMQREDRIIELKEKIESLEEEVKVLRGE